MAATIPIFDGTNYEFWKVKMETLFRSQDLLGTVQNGNGTDRDDATALFQIQQGVSDGIFPKIMNANTAREAWERLQNWDTPQAESQGTQRQSILERATKNRRELARVLARPANIEKSKEINLIVATLIATVTFAAGITMPGGYINDNKNPNQGMAILTRKAAFAAFVITDTIALTLSVVAVLIHLFMIDNPKLQKTQFALAICYTAYAMIAMLLAFITGTYAVLAPPSLFISVCVIPVTGLLLFNCVFDPYVVDLVNPMIAPNR